MTHASDALTVVARVASRRDIKRMAQRERFASALWPMPTLFGLAALVAAGITTTLDQDHTFGVARGRFLVADANTALTLTSVVATGMLVFLGIVFSTTLVAIQLAASQYSPRVVRVFLRARLTKVSLGVFVATFVFSLASLLEIRTADDTTPTVSLVVLTLLVLTTLIVFLVFANGTARLLRVQYLIERVAEETRVSLANAFPADEVYVDAVLPGEGGAGTLITSGSRSGVIDAVDLAGIAELARAADGWIEVIVPIGSYLGSDAPIAVAHANGSIEPDDVREALLLSNERTPLLDPGCGIRQIVDIAIRGLSPAVNDPTTAVQAVDRLTDLLGRVSPGADPAGWYVDDEGTVRLKVVVETFEELVQLAFVEVIRYGADSPQVVRRLRAAFDQLERRRGDGESAALLTLRALLDRATADMMPPAFTESASIADPRGFG